MGDRFDSAVSRGWHDLRMLGCDVSYEAFREAVCLVLGQLADPDVDECATMTVSELFEIKRKQRLARG